MVFSLYECPKKRQQRKRTLVARNACGIKRCSLSLAQLMGAGKPAPSQPTCEFPIILSTGTWTPASLDASLPTGSCHNRKNNWKHTVLLVWTQVRLSVATSEMEERVNLELRRGMVFLPKAQNGSHSGWIKLLDGWIHCFSQVDNSLALKEWSLWVYVLFHTMCKGL